MSSIVSVHSFRGGTGKSNLTANLATTIARRGRRVGIVDTDIQSPGIHVLFGLEEEQLDRSLNDYLRGECAIEDVAYDVGARLEDERGEPAIPDGAVYLIPASIKPGEIARVLREGYDVERLNDGFHQLVGRLQLDHLFIDTHPGLNEETLLSIAISGLLLVILRPDRQDYQGTAVTVEVARKLDVPKLLLLINKALPELDFDALRKQAEESYEAPVAGILPLSEDVVRLASGGIFCLRYPDHPWTRALARIAEQVAG
jgi:MinD-like ATPase involved in chromosome partitioning or flagellar assembly